MAVGLRCSVCRLPMPDPKAAVLRKELSPSECACDHTLAMIAAERESANVMEDGGHSLADALRAAESRGREAERRACEQAAQETRVLVPSPQGNETTMAQKTVRATREAIAQAIHDRGHPGAS